MPDPVPGVEERAEIAFEGVTWHDEFARCSECSHATVGLNTPYGINHLKGCSLAGPMIGFSGTPVPALAHPREETP